MQESNNIVEKFMDLFILENLDEDGLSKECLSENAPEAIQISLEPYVYEDVPLLKEMQLHATRTVQNGESNFQQEIEDYMNSILMPCLDHKTLSWSRQVICDKWKNYSPTEKMRMMDFVVVFDGVCQYLDETTRILNSGKRK